MNYTKLPITVIILTYNEEKNIKFCLESIKNADQIIIVDSYSTDQTLTLAKNYGVEIYEHEFKNQAQQFNWALDNTTIKNEWVLRLDADEYILPELWQEIAELNKKTSDVSNIGVNTRTSDVQKLDINGYYLKRRVYFMGRWIKYGGYYPTWILRLFKKDKARSENREMDEHIVLLEGQAGYLKNDFIDDNHKGLEFWVNKHNNFSSREIKEIMQYAPHPSPLTPHPPIGGQPAKRRWLKGNFYYRLPPFFRVLVYFIYRYFFRLGFLDGKEGLIFHFLQGFWYRFLVDAKLYEHNKKQQIKNSPKI